MSLWALDGGRLRWLALRLRAMPTAEIPHRLGRAARELVAHRMPPRWPGAGEADPAAGCFLLPEADLEPRREALPPYAAAIMRRADRVLAHQYRVFHIADATGGRPLEWNRDYASGGEVPLSPSWRVKSRATVRDARFVWEPNRHFHLVDLAVALDLTGRGELRERVFHDVERWIAENPFGRGMNWTSALEIAIRLVNWAWVWSLVRPRRDDGGVVTRWLESVHQHGCAVERNLSLHSSAGNHLLGEAAGLYVASLRWPDAPRASEWNAQGRAILEREAIRQIHEDGVPAEQSSGYAPFALDFLLTAGLWGEATGVPFPPVYWVRLHALDLWLRSIRDPCGRLPRIGDADDGHVTFRGSLKLEGLGPRRISNSVSLHVTFEALRNGGGPPRGDLDLKTFYLTRGPRPQPPPGEWDKPRDLFPHGGYRVFRAPGGFHLVLDCGPLGMEPMAGHGHADALAILVSVGGRPFFIDPGTYRYFKAPEWRRWFRGTSAHNTVTLDGRDQSVQAGPFLWGPRARCRVVTESSDESGVTRVEAEHDGYVPGGGPAHRRSVTLNRDLRSLWLEDRLIGGTWTTADVLLHLHPRVQADVRGLEVYLRHADAELHLRAGDGSHAGAWEAFRGSLDPRLGWYSPSYDRLHETTSLRLRTRTANRIITHLEW